jgi:hypothetical protein
MAFMTVIYLRNKIFKHWHEVTGHCTRSDDEDSFHMAQDSLMMDSY